MFEKKENRKVKYTKMVLRQSLLECMRDKPINKITVKEICERADVNRGTFYVHYKDPYDLLERIEQDLYAEIYAALEKRLQDSVSMGEVVREIFEYIVHEAALCKILFSEYGDTEFLEKIMNIAKEICEAEWSSMLPADRDMPLDYVYAFIAKGCVGVLQIWIQGGMRETAEEMAQMVMQIVYQGLGAFLQLPF